MTSELSFFLKTGFVILKDIVPLQLIENVLREFASITKSVLDNRSKLSDLNFNFKTWTAPKMHDHLIALRKERPEIFGEIYDQLSFCKSVRQLFQNELLVDKTSLLLKCPRNSIYSTGINLRMDVPFDKRNTIDWHQDSAHNQNIDKKSLVIWIPMHQVSEENGTISVCEKSHCEGIFPFKKESKTKTGFSEQRAIEDKIINRYKISPVMLSSGDAILFDWNLIHKSGFNTSTQIRFAARCLMHCG